MPCPTTLPLRSSGTRAKAPIGTPTFGAHQPLHDRVPGARLDPNPRLRRMRPGQPTGRARLARMHTSSPTRTGRWTRWRCSARCAFCASSATSREIGVEGPGCFQRLAFFILRQAPLFFTPPDANEHSCVIAKRFSPDEGEHVWPLTLLARHQLSSTEGRHDDNA
jgi:hypothetical protein